MKSLPLFWLWALCDAVVVVVVVCVRKRELPGSLTRSCACVWRGRQEAAPIEWVGDLLTVFTLEHVRASPAPLEHVRHLWPRLLRLHSTRVRRFGAEGNNIVLMFLL